MRFHIDGTGSSAAALTAALAAHGLLAADVHFEPAARGETALRIVLDDSMVSIAQLEDAVRAGWHGLLRWPPAIPARHAERLVALAEEAGTSVGILRPLRRVAELPRPHGMRASILTVAVDLPTAEVGRVESTIGDLVDLSSVLVGDASAQRTEVESTRGAGSDLSAVAATVRYQNGALAQLVLSYGEEPSRFHLVAAGGGVPRDAVTLAPGPFPLDSAQLIRDATAFVDALVDRRPLTASLADGLETLRIAERICRALR